MLAMQEACERPLMYLNFEAILQKGEAGKNVYHSRTHAYEPCSSFELSNICRWLYEPCGLTKMVRGNGSPKQQH
jgi:hypothetical protein